ncbi:hypothetical protein FIBSPDRAFT_963864 [Athelia psychrophila]|uniref:C2H2-type domain-containing protein n=1 Tax=Athelia psychrophila TaxID=1759441 RepID=A0A165YHI9_9AGAM|nr:hypothetical protein FIBSPDRAFT_963864 [Fibularhizoctonia sp. CBS 109695]
MSTSHRTPHTWVSRTSPTDIPTAQRIPLYRAATDDDPRGEREHTGRHRSSSFVARSGVPASPDHRSYVPIPRPHSRPSSFASSPPNCACGTRRLCIGCITQGPDDIDERNVASSSYQGHDAYRSPSRPYRNSISDYLSGMDIDVHDSHGSYDDLSDAGSGAEWMDEERRCQWGDGACGHVFSLSRTQGQSSLVTVIKSHLDEVHPEISTKDARGKYLCRWDGCRDTLATVTSVARHILTGKKHLDFGVPCPDCHMGSFRKDSLNIHRKRQSCKARKTSKDGLSE